MHLTAGLTAGTIVFTMSVTGVLLAFERQIIAFAERNLRVAAAGEPLPLSRLISAAGDSAGAPAASVLVRSDKRAPVTVGFGREGNLFVNPYSGAILGRGATGVRKFFSGVEDFHRWLALKGVARDRAKAVTGAANLLFFFLVLSGLYLWIPRTLAGIRQVAWFRGGLRGRARDFNWHNTLGVWAFLPLAIIVFSGIVISYPWATRLVYRAFGNEPPAPAPERPRENAAPKKERVDLTALDRIFSAASTEASRVAPDWQTLSFRLPLPARGKTNVTVDRGNGARPDKRSTLVLDATTGALLEHETYEAQVAGRKARSWLRWLHTGEAGGIAGQLIAMLATSAAVALAWTGVSLALRRFAAWTSRKSIKEPA
jgi:uncharacterized iron-regulated membrane protein